MEIKNMIQQMASRLEILENQKSQKQMNGLKNEKPRWIPSKVTSGVTSDKKLKK